MKISKNKLSVDHDSGKALLLRILNEEGMAHKKFWLPKVFWSYSLDFLSVPEDFKFKVFENKPADHRSFIGVELCEEFDLDYEI